MQHNHIHKLYPTMHPEQVNSKKRAFKRQSTRACKLFPDQPERTVLMKGNQELLLRKHATTTTTKTP